MRDTKETFWDTLSQLIPDTEKDIHQLIGDLKKTKTDPAKAKDSLMVLFDYIADNTKPKPIWSERAWALLDQISLKVSSDQT